MKNNTVFFLVLAAALSTAAGAQNVHYGESFELHSTLDASQSHEYTANHYIDLNPGFYSDPYQGNNTTLQLDSYGIYPPTAGVTGGPNAGDTGVVGAIGGVVEVGATGAAVYSIPIELPAGINGMQPRLSVTYNNQRGNGLLGWGWDLAGISAITRAGTTLYHDGYMSGADFDDDRFCLDGHRLMVVNGNYGTDGAEYKTETDAMAKIVSYTCDTTNGPAWFKVWTADGLVMEYGATAESRIGLSQRKDVCLWLLNRVGDRNGNYMTYHYEKGINQYSLLSITYTHNDTVPEDPAYKVEFSYETREDKERFFVEKNELKQSKLLKEILVKYDNDSVLWHYRFGYDQTTGLGTRDVYNRLVSIGFQCGDQSYNPTVVSWNQNPIDFTLSSLKVDGNFFHYVNDTDEYSDLGGIKFTGDFNGDGYSDLVTTWYNNDGKLAYVYLNTSGRSGDLWQLERADSIRIDDDVDWIYTGDFNGDGRSDLLFLNRELFDVCDLVTFDIYITSMNPDGSLSFAPCAPPQNSAYWIWHNKDISMAMGDFTGERRDSFVFQTVEEDKHTFKRFHIYYDESSGRMRQDDIGGINPNAEKVQSADFDGDGIAELWYYKTDQNVIQGKIVKMDRNKNFNEVNGAILTRYHKLFPGDFNGDGKADFLTFATDGNGGGTWQVNLSKESHLFWPQFDITDQMGIGDPGDHGFSIRSTFLQSYQYKMVAVADFNGDGKSDIATLKKEGAVYDSLIILYAPFNAQGCAFRQAVPKASTGMQTAFEYCTVIGNFLGRENASVCWLDDLFSVTPLSDRYTVESVTDGMGNTTAFQYGYLMPDLQDLNWDGYYMMSNALEDRRHGVFSVSLPVKGVREVSEKNAGGGTVATGYWYEGAVVHNRGKGFLGFAKKTVTVKNNTRVMSRTVTHGDMAMLDPFPMVVPLCDSVFDKDGNLLSCTQYSFVPFVNIRDGRQRVFLPLMTSETVRTWDLDRHLFQKKTCLMNTYSTDMPSLPSLYVNTVKHSVRWYGVTGDDSAAVQQDYEFQSSDETVFEPDILSSWTLNRPKRVTSRVSRNGGYGDVSHRVSYTYDPSNPVLVSSILSLPNDGSELGDPLAVQTEYVYDAFGRVATETLKAPNDNSLPDRTTSYQYSSDYGYRFLTGKTSPMGYTSSYAYDEYYGFVVAETDCNGRTTRHGRDPLGITWWTYYPDSTRSCVATRWNGGSGYCTWSKSSGEGSCCTYFGRKGQVSCTSVLGVNGEKTLVSTQYDGYGRVSRKSLPYFEGDTVFWTGYTYDGYDRLTRASMPDGTSEEISYDGLTTTREITPTVGNTHETVACSNVMGWTVSLSEKLDGGTENTVAYGHYADGALAWAKVNGQAGMCDSLRYDHNRNRVFLRDPDYGATSSLYNAFGELVTETDPKGNVTGNTYDNLGRMTGRTVTRGNTTLESTTWTYSETAGHKGLLSSVTHDNQTVSYTYDNFLRVSAVTSTIGNESYSRSCTYDSLSRVLTETFPSGVSVQYGYRASGSLHDITDSNTGVLLWRMEDANAAGQLTGTTLGNGIATVNLYDPLTGRLIGTRSTHPNMNSSIQRLSYAYDGFGNLLDRTDHRLGNGFGVTESFSYDRLDRLVTVALNGVQKGQTLYDNYGRITNKSADGMTVFSTDANSYNMADKPHALRSATVPGGLFPNTAQSIAYTHFDKVSEIVEGNNSLSYTYGHDRQRIVMEEHVGNTLRTKRYVGNCEYITETVGNATSSRWITYLSGPTGLFAVVDTENNTNTIHYILKDRLGSWTTITNSSGSVEQRLSYDAWGNLRDPETWSGSFNGTPMFDRGFTGHEHLWNFGLINMNGRMYDPVMSSFLSVDRYVQSPGNSQNFNRFAYCLNNPLRYIDPSGEFFWEPVLVGAFIGAFTNTATQLMSGNVNSSGQFWIAAGIGTVSGGLGGVAGYGAGLGTAAWFGSASWGAASGIATGAACGFSSGFVSASTSAWMQGANFFQGLWTGIRSGIIGEFSGAIMSGLEAGYYAKQCGGNFWTGKGISFDLPAPTCDGVPINKAYPNLRNFSNYSSIEAEETEWLKHKTAWNYDIIEGDLGVESISTQTPDGFILDQSTGLFVNNENGKQILGRTVFLSPKQSAVFISPYAATHPNNVIFRAVVGHELTHSYHIFIGLPIETNGSSERAAKDYSYMEYFRSGYIDLTKTITTHCDYNRRYYVPREYSFSTISFFEYLNCRK